MERRKELVGKVVSNKNNKTIPICIYFFLFLNI